MPHEFIMKWVDIYQPPSIDASHKGNAGIQITIGDLHGNAMKLMFMLVKHGIATNINKTKYKRLVGIYRIPVEHLTKNHLVEFNQILSQIKFSNDSIVRLIGDELADRGHNDYFTLKILEQLNEHKVPVEIIVSNHSIEFIEAYEKNNNFHVPMLSKNGHALSLENLQRLVDKKIVTREEILAIAKKSYKPTLRAISYSLSEDKNEITIYSHAGIGLNTIKNLARKLKVEYSDATTSQLAQSIDSINIQYQKHVQNNTVNTLYTRNKLMEGYKGDSDLSATPFEFIMWNRLYNHIDRPAVYSGYNVNFVHGHDPEDLTHNNIYNLDNELGKMELNIGKYTVLYSREGVVAPLFKPLELEESVNQSLNNEIIPLSEFHQYFLSQLEEIKIKEQDLRVKDHIVAADFAKDLYKTLKTKHQELTDEKIDIQTFKDSCTDAINIARAELEKHRGWKQILGNLVLAVAGMGALYLIAGLIHKTSTGNFLFFKTDSAHKIDQLEQSVKSFR